MEQNENWIDDALSGFLKIEEGEHRLKVFGPPVREQSKWGKDQWVFEGALLDDRSGKMAANKGLLRILASVSKDKIERGKKAGIADNGFPVEIHFRRTGTDLKTKFEVLA